MKTTTNTAGFFDKFLGFTNTTTTTVSATELRVSTEYDSPLSKNVALSAEGALLDGFFSVDELREFAAHATRLGAAPLYASGMQAAASDGKRLRFNDADGAPLALLGWHGAVVRAKLSAEELRQLVICCESLDAIDLDGEHSTLRSAWAAAVDEYYID